MESEFTCCFIGLHAQNLIFIFDEEVKQRIRLKQIILDYIVDLIKHHHVIHFISDMSLGFGIYAAETVLSLKPVYSDITLECTLPYEEQASGWSAKNRERYFGIIEKCDKEMMFQRQYSDTCFKMNERYMINHSQYVLAYHNVNIQDDIIRYARSKDRKIKLINPDEIHDLSINKIYW